MSEVNWMRWKPTADRAGQRGRQRGLADARNVLDQQMPAGQEPDDGQPDRLRLAHQHPPHVVFQPPDQLDRANRHASILLPQASDAAPAD